MLIINGGTDDAGHEDPGHPERPERLAAVMKGIEDLQLGDDLLAVAPYSASRSELARVHESTYLDQLGAFCFEGGGDLDEDTYATYDSWALAQHAAGAGLAVVKELRIRGEGTGFVAVRHRATTRCAIARWDSVYSITSRLPQRNSRAWVSGS